MIWRLVSNFAMELSRPYRKAAMEFDAAQKGTLCREIMKLFFMDSACKLRVKNTKKVRHARM